MPRTLAFISVPSPHSLVAQELTIDPQNRVFNRKDVGICWFACAEMVARQYDIRGFTDLTNLVVRDGLGRDTGADDASITTWAERLKVVIEHKSSGDKDRTFVLDALRKRKLPVITSHFWPDAKSTHAVVTLDITNTEVPFTTDDGKEVTDYRVRYINPNTSAKISQITWEQWYKTWDRGWRRCLILPGNRNSRGWARCRGLLCCRIRCRSSSTRHSIKSRSSCRPIKTSKTASTGLTTPCATAATFTLIRCTFRPRTRPSEAIMTLLDWLKKIVAGWRPPMDVIPTNPWTTPIQPLPPSAPPQTPPAPPTPPPNIDAIQAQLLAALHNTQRAAPRHVRTPRCRTMPALQLAASNHAAWMADNRNMDHNEIPGTPSFTGQSFVARVAAANFAMGAGGENIAAGQPSVSEVMAAWMLSPGHRANILNAVYTGVGFGLAYDAYHLPYWCAVFACEFPAGEELLPKVFTWQGQGQRYVLPDAIVKHH